MNVDELIVRFRDNREQLRSVGGYDNGLVNVPAHGVRKIIEDAEQLCDAYEALRTQLETVRGIKEALLIRVDKAERNWQAAEAKVDALEKDAARYRWFRQANLSLHDMAKAIDYGDEHLDAAIDAAMTKDTTK